MGGVCSKLARTRTQQIIDKASEHLLATAQVFEKSAKKLACQEWCMKMKMYFIILAAVVLIVGLIVYFQIPKGVNKNNGKKLG